MLVHGAGAAREWRELAKQAFELGYGTLLVPDHFGRQLAPFAALVAAAEAVAGLRVGTFVLDNDFRHPALAAKEAATVDLLTDGRLELGIGAGWNPADYAKTGLVFEPAGTRVARLAEAVQIIKAFFGAPDERVSFQGQHYAVNDLDAWPKPVQQPRPPLLLGAAGKRMLTLAAQEADILNFPDRPSHGVSTAGNPALGLTFEEQIAIVRSAAGKRYAQLELSSLVIPRITDRPTETYAQLASQMQTTPEVIEAMPGALVGTVDAIEDKLKRNRQQYDLSYFVVPGAAMEQMAPLVARLAGT